MSSVAASIRRVLWNDRERRPRTPWRLALGAFVVVVVGVVGTVPLALLGVLRQDVATVLAAVIATTAQVAVYAALTAGILTAAWLVDRRFLRDLGFSSGPDGGHGAGPVAGFGVVSGVESDVRAALGRAWWDDLAFGLGLGVAMPAVVFALELALGYAAVSGVLVRRTGTTLPPSAGGPFALAFALTAGYFVAVGVFEELLFRGYLLTNAAEGLRGLEFEGVGAVGTMGAIVVATAGTSVLFGFVHAANPNATALAVGIISCYGGFLAAGYLLTGRIAVPVGVHVTWNLSVSSVFGFPVSGVTTPVSLVAVEVSGPDVVTGGAFGPEGGLVSLVALGVGVAALLGWVRWREGGVGIDPCVAVPALRTGDAGDDSSADPSEAAAVPESTDPADAPERP